MEVLFEDQGVALREVSASCKLNSAWVKRAATWQAVSGARVGWVLAKKI